MRFDVDGVADDGRPGEGDNILPGNLVVVDVTGDHVFVGDGNDYLFSEFGNDILVGGPGVDRFDSRPFAQGDQTIYARDGEVDEEIDCGDGVDTAYVDFTEGPITGCETVIPG
jgi:hypothetical protein